ncbi:hypothetical protein BJ875DRAFT_547765 [Amylocarpus encephaloides]|uniref:Uncharacterized protein n=1 Tax=Amylocarpus encephaloides TaxID=45428 RepID=A0A9P8C0R3_9HELO|nr:hypothetical protein BJ875DRAFT_547765 [Amylocarpus encephaloides]
MSTTNSYPASFLPAKSPLPNVFITASPSLTAPLEIHPDDPQYFQKRLAQIQASYAQFAVLESEIEKTCYPPNERSRNRELLDVAREDLVAFEKSLDLGKRIEERLVEVDRVQKQIEGLWERKMNLEEEAQTFMEVFVVLNEHLGLAGHHNERKKVGNSQEKKGISATLRKYKRIFSKERRF